MPGHGRESPSRSRGSSPEDLLVDLDPEQRAAVELTRGPLVVHAGAGSGKTRVITRRVAYAAATGAQDARHALVVTFTDRAAREMEARLRALGVPGVAASTFHAAALRQLSHFWPQVSSRPFPRILASKLPLVAPLSRALPGGYRFRPAKDLADEIEWAKVRRLAPATYQADPLVAAGRSGPLPPALFATFWRDYERAKDRAGAIDFEDMLARTLELIGSNDAVAARVRARYRWFTVDEFQDTNALGYAVLLAWLGERLELCVVGDEDQTIYSFTGATSAYLREFAARFPDAREVTLSRNYRSSPQVLDLANRLLASEGRAKRLVAMQDGGPAPGIHAFATAEAELAALVREVCRHLGEGIAPSEVAVLVRTNAQLVSLEAALAAAGIGYQVVGAGFYARPEVRQVIAELRRAGLRPVAAESDEPTSARLLARAEAVIEHVVAADAAEETAAGEDARQREASGQTLRAIAAAFVAAHPEADLGAFADDLSARAAEEGSTRGAGGVELLTFHRAKGLEWDAVLLPGLEEGTLPIRQALADPEALAEERRLLYVGLTRARRVLWLGWAHQRAGQTGRESARQRSRFLGALAPPPARRVSPNRPDPRILARRRAPGSATPSAGAPAHRGGRHASAVASIPGASSPSGIEAPPEADVRLAAALRAWRRERAQLDGVPAYVVFPDATLAALVAIRPADIATLAGVRGFGPSRVQHYGPEIVELIRDAG